MSMICDVVVPRKACGAGASLSGGKPPAVAANLQGRPKPHPPVDDKPHPPVDEKCW